MEPCRTVYSSHCCSPSPLNLWRWPSGPVRSRACGGEVPSTNCRFPRTTSYCSSLTQTVPLVLPKFLYLFQSIPLFIPKHFFHSLDGSISQFIWNKKPPRIRKDTLQNPKEMGGLALSNFLCYYWAANIQSILHWYHINNQPPMWLQIEGASCGSPSLMSYYTLHTNQSSSSYKLGTIWCEDLDIETEPLRSGSPL